MNYEYEAKALISKNDYDKLISANKIINSISQSNIYFETDDEWFKHNKSALRIRQISLKPTILTIKIQIEDGNIEHNYELSSEQTKCLLNELKVPNFDFPISFPRLTKKYPIVTKRKTFEFEGAIVEIDETSFGDVIDYEIEIEASSLAVANNKLANLAKKFDIQLNNSAPKIARYFMYNQKKDQ